MSAAPVGPPLLPAAPAELGTALEWLDETCRRPPAADDLTGWLDLVGLCQRVINSATAAQDAAMARAATIETDWDEDGTAIERRHLLGAIQLDSADLVATRRAVPHAVATHRLEAAVRIATAHAVLAGQPSDERETEPAPCDQAGAEQAPSDQAGAEQAPSDQAGAEQAETEQAPAGFAAVHAAMREGRLDAYRAGVIIEELDAAPDVIVAAVIATIDERLATETGAGLRRRFRRTLAKISPDLLRQRALRARRDCGLRRWVSEPGVDAWMATFPSEEAATAWKAIDELARHYLRDQVVTDGGIDRARAKALTDLVTGHATIEVQVQFTVPADCGAAPGDLVEAALTARPQPDFIDPAWVEARAAVPNRARGMTGSGAGDGDYGSNGGHAGLGVGGSDGARDSMSPTVGLAPPQSITGPALPCRPDTGALTDPGDVLATDAYHPGTKLAALIRARDGHCRFPGCGVAARFCDLDHVVAWPAGPTAAGNLICLCRRHHRIKQRPGWRVVQHGDARVTWTDPTGQVRITDPIDRLTPIVLTAGADPPVPQVTPGRVRDPIPEPISMLEFQLGHRVAALTHPAAPAPTARTPITRAPVAQASISRAPVTRTALSRSRGRRDGVRNSAPTVIHPSGRLAMTVDFAPLGGAAGEADVPPF